MLRYLVIAQPRRLRVLERRTDRRVNAEHLARRKEIYEALQSRGEDWPRAAAEKWRNGFAIFRKTPPPTLTAILTAIGGDKGRQQ